MTSRNSLLSVHFWSTTSPSGGGFNVTPQKFSADCDRGSDRPTTVGGWTLTYIRVKGKWVYLYRAVDSTGATIDFLLSAKCDAAAAECFLAKALGGESGAASHQHRQARRISIRHPQQKRLGEAFWSPSPSCGHIFGIRSDSV